MASAWLPLAIAQSADAAQEWIIAGPGQGPVALPAGGTGASQLSGIAWTGGNQFLVVGDNAAAVFPLTVDFQFISGWIESAALATGVALSTGSDLEGLAYDAANASVLVSDESGPALREHALADGALLQSVALPAVFGAIRPNLSLESLSRSPDGSALWTANEEALTVDGPVASSSAGTVVRLQRFDAGLTANGQWAYVTDPIDGDIGSSGRDLEVSGVSDLVALDGGQLLVLERALGASGFRNRIYEVDFSAATDVSAIPSLSSATFTPVARTLLWEGFSNANFEGIALGPPLANGARALLLVSDSGTFMSQSLWSLTLHPNTPVCAAAPRSGCIAAPRSKLVVASRGGSRDKLVWSWRNGTLPDLAVFGDPLAALGHGLALCVYDSVAAVSQLRMAVALPPGSNWEDSDATTRKFRDRGALLGIASLKLRAGIGNAKLTVRGAGAALGVPTPPPSGTLFNRDPDVTVQLVNRDDPAQCLTASYTTARREDAAQFKAKQ